MMRTISDTQVAMIRGDIRASGVEIRDLEDDLLDHICTTIEFEADPGTPFDRIYEEVKSRICPDGYREIHDETIAFITQKYNNMKKFMNTAGIAGSAGLVFGSLTKTLHLPGAGVLLGIGTLIIVLGYLPLMLMLALQQTDTGIGKIRNISGYIGANLIVAGIYLQIMHYTDNRILVVGLGLFLLVFVPLYLKATGKDAVLKIQPVTISVVLIAIVSSLFAFSNKKPSRAFYHGLAMVTEDIQSSYEIKYATLKTKRTSNDELAILSDAALSYIDGLKEEITGTIGFKSMEDVLAAKRVTTFSDKLDVNLTTTSAAYSYNGIVLHEHLSQFLTTLTTETPDIKTYIDISKSPEEWVMEHFYQKPLYSSYSQLTNLQLEIVSLELASRNNNTP